MPVRLFRRRTTLRRTIVTATTIVLAPVVIATATAFAGNILEVTAEQSVTVVGVFPSLKSVITDICRSGGVELRAFEAADRPVTVAYNAVPFTNALEGLLREESYLVGVTAGEAGKSPRVAWIRIVASGDNAPQQLPPSGASGASSRPMPTLGFEVPATFGDAEFSSEDPEQRARALHAIANRLLATKQILETDPHVVAATLQQYPHARELVAQLRNEQQDPDVRVRLDQILAALH